MTVDGSQNVRLSTVICQLPTAMVERSELITVCRQIGGMMEAGVDILRVTRVLRAQTENPRLLELYDALDHDLKMGRSLADAIERAPDVFSPFAVSLVQQGEDANDLAGAFLKFADFLQQEEASAQQSAVAHSAARESDTQRNAEQTQGAARGEAFGSASSASDFAAAKRSVAQRDGRAASDSLPQVALDELIGRLQGAGLQALNWLSCLLLCLAAVCAMAEAGWLQRRWLSVALLVVAVLFLAATGVWLRRRITTGASVANVRRARKPVAEEGPEEGPNESMNGIERGLFQERSSAAGAAMKPQLARGPERNGEPDAVGIGGVTPGLNSNRNDRTVARPASSLSEEDYE
jgi:hypothetical protein